MSRTLDATTVSNQDTVHWLLSNSCFETLDYHHLLDCIHYRNERREFTLEVMSSDDGKLQRVFFHSSRTHNEY